MADILSTAVSGLEAFQQALSVTANNISNASTPGYTRQTIQLAPAVSQNLGTGYVGSGVDVTGVIRNLDQFAQAQLQSANQSVSQQNALVGVATQVDNTLGNSSNGIAAALSAFYGSLQTLSTNPTSASLRGTVLAQAQALAQSISQTASTLAGVSSTVGGQVSSAVTQINSLTTNIAKLNAQIVQASSAGAGQAPNSLLDQRDQLLGQLGQLVGIRTSTETNGTVDVYVGSGQAVVVGNQSTALSVSTGKYNTGTPAVIYGSGNAAADISGLLSGGSLSGYLQAQNQVLTPALNGLGQIATAIALSVNNQQAQGVSANNTLGPAIFSVPAPTISASATNAGTASLSAAVTNVGALTASNYILTYNGGTWTATDAQTGAPVPLTPVAANASPPAVPNSILIPAPPNGVTAALTIAPPTGTPANGDTFLVQATAPAATGITVSLTDPNGIATSALVTPTATAAATNTGTGVISAPYASTPGSGPSVASATTIRFTSPTSYSVTTGATVQTGTFTPGVAIPTPAGLSVVITGAPATGDSFTIPAQSGTGTDNANALALAQLQTTGVLSGGTASVSTAFSTLVGQIGTTVQSATTTQTALQAVATQANQTAQSTSGVNLDEEGAKLIQWQQAYTAAGRVISVADSLFTTLLTDIQNG